VIEQLSSTGAEATIDAEIAIVGAGPAGIVTALELARHGIPVVVIESGLAGYDPTLQALSEADRWDPARHATMTLAVRRQVGGASVIWGGRCVPYDPVDFEQRSFVSSSSWPIGYEAISRYVPRACDWLVCGRPVFSASNIDHLAPTLLPGLADGDITTSTLERWSLPTNFAKRYHKELQGSRFVRVVTGATCTEIVCAAESGRAELLRARTMTGRPVVVRARTFVIAAGGLESTRLLMTSKGPGGQQLGNHSGHLGRWYMAHAEGVIASVRFFTHPRQTIYGYERDVDGTYVRRRFAFTAAFQRRHEVPNIVAWLTNPELSDSAHRSGPLSFVYLALRSPLGHRFAPDAQRRSLTGERVPGAPYGGATRSPSVSHLRNVIRSPVSTGHFLLRFGTDRFLRHERRAPGFFVYNRENRYPLQFHGEHLPNPASSVSLSPNTDALGRPKLDIDLRFSSADVDGVVRAHRLWDAWLRAAGVGRLEYHGPDPYESVDRCLGGGFHQIGTARMSASPDSGVVDRDLAVHGVQNVYVVSSATFVTSSQANSTLMIVAFAVRLADRLRQKLRPPTPHLGVRA